MPISRLNTQFSSNYFHSDRLEKAGYYYLKKANFGSRYVKISLDDKSVTVKKVKASVKNHFLTLLLLPISSSIKFLGKCFLKFSKTHKIKYAIISNIFGKATGSTKKVSQDDIEKEIWDHILHNPKHAPYLIGMIKDLKLRKKILLDYISTIRSHVKFKQALGIPPDSYFQCLSPIHNTYNIHRKTFISKFDKLRIDEFELGDRLEIVKKIALSRDFYSSDHLRLKCGPKIYNLVIKKMKLEDQVSFLLDILNSPNGFISVWDIYGDGLKNTSHSNCLFIAELFSRYPKKESFPVTGEMAPALKFLIKQGANDADLDDASIVEFEEMMKDTKVKLEDLFSENVKKAKKEKNGRYPLFRWLSFSLLYLSTFNEEKKKIIKDSKILEKIYNYRDPEMRYSLLRNLYFLTLENEDVLKDISKKKKWVQLTETLLVRLLPSGISKKDLSKTLTLIEKEKRFNDCNNEKILVDFVCALMKTNIKPKKKLKCLRIALKNKSFKDKLKALRLMSVILTIFGEDRFIKEVLEAKNPDLEEIFSNSFNELFSIGEIEDLSETYEKTFGQFRDPIALYTYLGSVKKLPEYKREEVSEVLTKYVKSVITGKYPKKRYKTEDNSHLQTISANRDGLLDEWQKKPETKMVEEVLSTSEKDSGKDKLDFHKFVKDKIETDGHLEIDDYPDLQSYLDNSANFVNLLKKLSDEKKELEKKDTKTEEEAKKLAKIILQIELINLIRNNKKPKQQIQTLKKIQQQLQILPKTEFRNDVSGFIKKLESSSSSVNDLTITDTDDACDMLLIGTEIYGSCQRVNGNPSLNKCLVAYLMDGKNRAIVIKRPDGKIVARSIFRLMWDSKNKKPVLLLERIYSNINDSNIDKAIEAWAKKRAEELKLTLVSKDVDKGPKYNGNVESKDGPAPYEYSDAVGGTIVGSKFTVDNCHLL